MIFRLTTMATVSRSAKKYSRNAESAPATDASGGFRLSSSSLLYCADEQRGHDDPHGDEEQEVAVGDGQQAAEEYRFDLVHVELPRDGDQQAQAEAERERMKHADERVRRKRGVPLHEHHGERGDQAEPEHAAVRRVQRLADEQPDGHAGQRRLAERRAEERHPARDDEMTESAEHRRQHEHA